MGTTLDDTEYTSWVSHLFPSIGYGPVGAVSIGVSAGFLVVGYLIAAVSGLPVLDISGSLFLGAFSAFWMLAALGLAEDLYVDVWREVRPAFDVDDGTYFDVVTPRLEGIHDTRRVLLCAALLVVPYVAVVAVSHLPGLPFHGIVEEWFYGGETTYPDGVPSVVILSLFGTVNGVLIATIVNGFVTHLFLVSEVSDLPFRNVHTSASELEPIADFTVASATVWFAGTSLVILWIRTGISSDVGLTIIALLVLWGVVFFVAPQLILHDALLDAKREKIAEIRGRYHEMHEMTGADADPSGDLSLRLKLTDRRLEHAKAIRTWVYDLSSMGKLVAASVLPWLTLVQKLISTGGALLGS